MTTLQASRDQQRDQETNLNRSLHGDESVFSQLSLEDSLVGSLDSQCSQVSLLKEIWDICQTSPTRVKLMLPDVVKEPYYLGKPHAFGKKPLTDAQKERELKRYDNMYVGQTSPRRSNRTSPVSIFKLRNRKELAIEAKLMDEYRRDNRKLSVLMERLAARKKEGAVEQAVTEGLPKKELIPTAPESPISRAQRQTLVVSRRTSIMQTEQANHSSATKQWEEKVSSLALTNASSKTDKSKGRVKQWVLAVAVLTKLGVMSRVVLAVRKAKAKDLIKWKACVKIQKCYRNHLYKTHRFRLRARSYSSGSPKNTVSRIRKSMVGSDLLQQKYFARKDASTLITVFLRDMQRGFKATVLGFIRKVKVVQRMVRTHLVANSGRVHLINLYLEECYPVLSMHTSTVLADKGLDLKNLTSMDVSKMKIQISSRQRFHIVSELNSVGFHSFLRNYSDRLRDISSVFGATKHLHSTDSPARRRVILDLVYKKRRQYVAQLYAARKMVLKIPQVTLTDVRQFIHGGVDPIQVYLSDAYKKYDAAMHPDNFDNHFNLHVIKDESGQTLRNSSLSLLKSITPEDLGLLYIVVAEKSMESRQQARRLQQTQGSKLLASVGTGSGSSSHSNPRASVSGASMLYSSRAGSLPSTISEVGPSVKNGSSTLSGASPTKHSYSGDVSDVPSAGRRQSTMHQHVKLKHNSVGAEVGSIKEESSSASIRPATPPGRKNSNSLLEKRRSSRKY